MLVILGFLAYLLFYCLIQCKIYKLPVGIGKCIGNQKYLVIGWRGSRQKRRHGIYAFGLLRAVVLMTIYFFQRFKIDCTELHPQSLVYSLNENN